jgi:hypothetical protein
MNIVKDDNIVDLSQRQPLATVSGHPGGLLKLVQGVALKRIDALINTLFENIDDALFDLAEKAENNADQTGYLDGMRDVRKKRASVKHLFQEQLSKMFDDFAVAASKPKAEGVIRSGDLTLVDEAELEESLAIASTTAKAENRLVRRLFALNQRLSTIRGGIPVDNASNPIAPATLCAVFQLATREFNLSNNARLIIYKLFDRYVMSGLDALYDEVDAQLIHVGALPQIRLGAAQGERRASTSMPGVPSVVAGGHAVTAAAYGQAVAAHAVYPQHYDPAATQLQSEIYNTVRLLLEGRRMIAPAAEQPLPEHFAGAHSLAPTDLLSALTLLQNQAMMAQAHATSAGDAVQIVQQIKQQLLDQAGKFHGNTKAHVAGADEDTIDLVGMLFEFILQDRNLPSQMQAMLGRLQIPFLRVALVDKHLFAQKTHPARQLLDSLAHACVGWSEESDRDHRLHDKVKQIVESLLKDFDDDLGMFERTRAEFEIFLKATRKGADLAEQRAAEATQGREKLQWARRTSAREILNRIEGKKLPDIVRNVLTRPWANFLVLTLLRQGEESDEWREALRFADDFAWSAQAKTSDAERTRLRDLMPDLQKSLRLSLATVAYHESDVTHVIHELDALYANILNGAPQMSSESLAADEKPIAPAGEPALFAVADGSFEEVVMRGDNDEVAPEVNFADNDECLKLAREMTVGKWVEFTNPDTGTKERAKLSWVSPISSKYLFVNRKGLKVSDKTIFALAAEIRRGLALILEQAPLFDRALDAIVGRLKAGVVANRRIALANP